VSSQRSVRLGSLFRREKRVGYLNETMLSVFRGVGVVRKDSRENYNKTAEDRSIYQLVEDGWLVINRMKAWQGSVGIAFERGTVSGHYLCFRPRHSECPRFLDYLLRSEPYVHQFRRLSRGVRPGQAEIDNDWLNGLPIHLAPGEEQQRIAGFLDDQVARLDAAVKCVGSARGVVEQRRAAVHASLFADLRARRVRLGLFARVQTGVTVDNGRQGVDGREYPYLSVANVQDGRLALDLVKTIVLRPAEARRFALRIGDVLMTEGGDLDKLGRGTVWRGEAPDCLHQNHVFAVRPNAGRVLSEYLALATQAPDARTHFQLTARKTTNLASTNSSNIRDWRVPLPGLDEQRAVVDRLERVDKELEAALKAAQGLSRLLDERKRALITACVTGDFDVAAASTRAGDAAMAGLA